MRNECVRNAEAINCGEAEELQPQSLNQCHAGELTVVLAVLSAVVNKEKGPVHRWLLVLANLCKLVISPA